MVEGCAPDVVLGLALALDAGLAFALVGVFFGLEADFVEAFGLVVVVVFFEVLLRVLLDLSLEVDFFVDFAGTVIRLDI